MKLSLSGIFRKKKSGNSTLRTQLKKKYGKKGFPRKVYEEEGLSRAAIMTVADNTMTSYERMVTLWQQVRYLDRANIPGALVECGTWRGGACGMMALSHMSHGKPPHRELHLFDSFEGLPEPDKDKDGGKAIELAEGRAEGSLSAIGCCVGSLEENRRLMHEVIKYPESLTSYHVGWFQDTVPGFSRQAGPIALLRLDGDWYDSTKICLEAFYDLVVPGGIIVIDDYGYWSGCRRAVDEFVAKLDRLPFLNHIDISARYIIKD
ncbi:MAG: TylF/MycF/NovP-related O-methyltransferase [Nitrospirota bacterium]